MWRKLSRWWETFSHQMSLMNLSAKSAIILATHLITDHRTGQRTKITCPSVEQGRLKYQSTHKISRRLTRINMTLNPICPCRQRMQGAAQILCMVTLVTTLGILVTLNTWRSQVPAHPQHLRVVQRRPPLWCPQYRGIAVASASKVARRDQTWADAICAIPCTMMIVYNVPPPVPIHRLHGGYVRCADRLLGVWPKCKKR